MTDKTRSQTFQQISTQQDIKDIFNQSNITLKKRHSGLTVKFNNNIDDTNKLVNKRINDELKNSNKDEILQTESKEGATQNEINIEKIINNFKKYTYNSITIFEDEKINKLRKEIFNLKKQLKINKEKDKNLNEELSIIRNNLFELELIELKLLRGDFNRLQTKRNEQKINDDELKKLNFLKENIEEKEEEISKLKILKKKLLKEINNNYNKINKLNSNKNKENKEINKYTKKLSIPSEKPLTWFDKSDNLLELEKKFQKATSIKDKEKMLRKMSTLNKQMKKIWNDKKVEKNYEEILPINNEVYFITTIVHADHSITEEIMYFDNNERNKLTVLKQRKQYANINEYKNDFSLIEKIPSNKNNLSFSEISIKDFIKQHNDFKIKPTKTEKRIWWTITIISLSLIILTPILTFAVPAILPAAAGLILVEKIAISVSAAGLGTIFKGFTSFFSTATKKVESWWYNKLCKNNEKNEKEKKELESIIKNLTSDKIEIKLQTQFNILKQELDNRKNKGINELISNENNNNSNSILKSSNIEPLNINNFDLSIRNTINHQNQPSTSTIMYHSNLIP